MLSRFMKLTWDKGQARLSSGLSGASLELDARQLALVHSLRQPTARAGLEPGPLRQMVDRLEELGMLCEVDTAGQPIESPALRQWEEADLSFHRASRNGKGPTLRFRGVLPPEPLFLAPRKGAIVKLPKRAKKPARSRSFSDVLAARRTRRSFAAQPMSLSRLGEFLHQTARIDEVVEKGSDGAGARRPFPSPGARHPLEIYLLLDATTCRGLDDEGLFHYRPREHALQHIASMNRDAAELIRVARGVALVEEGACVPIFVTARMARLSWKYEGMAYSLALKELGGLFQTFYLVAEAQGLNACAMGAGADRAFSRLSGCDPIAEPQIGEFIVGVPGRRVRHDVSPNAAIRR